MTQMDDQTRARKKEAFLADYRRYGIIGPAADMAGIHRRTILNWRANDEDFDAACIDAHAHAVDLAEQELRTRAVEGRNEPILFKGQLVWKRDPLTGEVELDDDFNPVPLTISRRSDRLLEVYTKAYRPQYKDKASVEVSGPDGGPIPASVTVRFIDSDGEGGRAKDPLED